MKSFYSPNRLLLIAALPLALIPMASRAGLEIDKDGDAHVTTDNGQTLDLKTLTTLPLKLLSLASESGLEIDSSEQGEVIVDNNKVLDIQASGKDVAVTGNGNTIHIHGDLPRLALIGRDNVVELDRVGTIALLGAQNQVSYLSGLGSDGPTIDRVGTNNSVTVRAAQNASRPPPTAAAQTNVNPKLPVWHKNRPQSPSYGSRKVVAFVLIDLQAF